MKCKQSVKPGRRLNEENYFPVRKYGHRKARVKVLAFYMSCNNFATTSPYDRAVRQTRVMANAIPLTKKGVKIMNGKWKRYRVLLIAAGMAVCMTAGLVVGIQWSRSHTEKAVAKAADQEQSLSQESGEGSGTETQMMYYPDLPASLYKDEVADQEIVKEVCDKYGLDYDTVQLKDVTREMRNYEEALWLRKDMGERPLLSEEASEDNEDVWMSSLEIYICDIYAFGGGKEVIEGMCKDFGVDPHGAVVSDLTTEQLIKICEKAYETSDHPKE